jgi:hypothetical protein
LQEQIGNSRIPAEKSGNEVCEVRKDGEFGFQMPLISMVWESKCIFQRCETVKAVGTIA